MELNLPSHLFSLYRRPLPITLLPQSAHQRGKSPSTATFLQTWQVNLFAHSFISSLEQRQMVVRIFLAVLAIATVAIQSCFAQSIAAGLYRIAHSKGGYLTPAEGG